MNTQNNNRVIAEEEIRTGLSTPVTDDEQLQKEAAAAFPYYPKDQFDLTNINDYRTYHEMIRDMDLKREGYIAARKHSVTPVPTDLRNDLDELIEAVFNDKLYGTSAGVSGRPHDPNPEISKIKERILNKHSVTPVLTEQQIKEEAEKVYPVIIFRKEKPDPYTGEYETYDYNEGKRQSWVEGYIAALTANSKQHTDGLR